MRGTDGARLGVGVVGCGNISATYMRNAALFAGVEILACADAAPAAAGRRAGEFGLGATTVEELLGDPAIDLVLNLTVPAAHFAVSLTALEAGKHVFTEKPLATSLEAGGWSTGIRARSSTTSQAAGRCWTWGPTM